MHRPRLLTTSSTARAIVSRFITISSGVRFLCPKSRGTRHRSRLTASPTTVGKWSTVFVLSAKNADHPNLPFAIPSPTTSSNTHLMARRRSSNRASSGSAIRRTWSTVNASATYPSSGRKIDTSALHRRCATVLRRPTCFCSSPSNARRAFRTYWDSIESSSESESVSESYMSESESSARGSAG